MTSREHGGERVLSPRVDQRGQLPHIKQTFENDGNPCLASFEQGVRTVRDSRSRSRSRSRRLVGNALLLFVAPVREAMSRASRDAPTSTEESPNSTRVHPYWREHQVKIWAAHDRATRFVAEVTRAAALFDSAFGFDRSRDRVASRSFATDRESAAE